MEILNNNVRFICFEIDYDFFNKNYNILLGMITNNDNLKKFLNYVYAQLSANSI